MSRFWVEKSAWKRRKNMSFFLAKTYGPGLKSRLRKKKRHIFPGASKPTSQPRTLTCWWRCVLDMHAHPRRISIERTGLAVRCAFCVSVICAAVLGYWRRRLPSSAGNGACDMPVACACICALQCRRPLRAEVHGHQHHAALLGEHTSVAGTPALVGAAV